MDTPNTTTPTPPTNTTNANGNGRKPPSAHQAQLRTLSSLRTLNSILVDRQHLASQLGATFDGDRNLHTALGYKPTLTITDYRYRFNRGGIAKRVVKAYPQAIWGGGADIQEDPDPDISTPFEQAFKDLAKKLDLWSKLMKAHVLCNLGKYSIILLQSDSGPLNTPLTSLLEPKLFGLALRAEDRAKIEAYVTNESDPRFGLPERYNIEYRKDAYGTSTTPTSVHYSRVIHVVEESLEDDIFGTPRLEAVWNYLDDLDKIIGGGAEASFIRANPGMHLDLDPEIELDDGAQKNIEEQIDEYLHNLRRVLQTRGVDIKTLSADVNNFNTNALTVLKLIAGTEGIPERILTGSERGELASSQDRNNWNDRIQEGREGFAEPLTRQVVDRLIELGTLPEPSNEYEIVWPETDELTEDEKAIVTNNLALANKAQSESGEGVILTANEIRDRVWGLEPLEEDEEGEIEIGDGEDDGEDEDSDEEEADSVETSRAAADAGSLSDSPTTQEPEWKSVHRAADEHLTPLSRVFLRAWEDVQDEIDMRQLESFISKGQQDNGIERATQHVSETAIRVLNQRLADTLPSRLLSTLNSGGQAALRSARSRGGFLPKSPRDLLSKPITAADTDSASTFSAQFDESNPRAVRFATEQSSVLITEITKETVYGVQQLIAQGVRDGIPPRKLAKQVRSIVGLRSDQITALNSFRAKLAVAQPGSIVNMGSTRKVRVPKSGVTERFLQQQTERYTKVLHQQRARLIARTETLRSANEGQRELWRQAVDNNQLPADQKRVWIDTADGRTRDDHRAMRGQIRGIEEKFQSPSGALIEPGEEPNCRCAQGLATEADIKSYQEKATV